MSSVAASIFFMYVNKSMLYVCFVSLLLCVPALGYSSFTFFSGSNFDICFLWFLWTFSFKPSPGNHFSRYFINFLCSAYQVALSNIFISSDVMFLAVFLLLFICYIKTFRHPSLHWFSFWVSAWVLHFKLWLLPRTSTWWSDLLSAFYNKLQISSAKYFHIIPHPSHDFVFTFSLLFICWARTELLPLLG